MKRTKFPSDDEINLVRKKLNKAVASKPFPVDGDPTDKIKHKICTQFILYKRKYALTQRDLAKLIGIDEALTSKILHYHTDEFSIDRLMKFLSLLYSKVDVYLEVA